jgi:phage FluMu protein Com
MARTIKCSSCGATLNLGESWTHAKAKCSKCNAVVDVPPAAEIPMPKPTQDKPQAATASTATNAPAPTETKSYRKVIVAAIAATFTVGFLFGCCAASVVFWTFPRVQGVLPQGVKGAADKATGKPKDDMTFQELEDRLNATGITVTRTASKFRNVMWFGNQINPQAVMIWEEANAPWGYRDLYDAGCFRVTKHESSNQAKDSAVKIADVQQRPAFAWGPFVFEGRQEVLDNVKAALSK